MYFHNAILFGKKHFNKNTLEDYLVNLPQMLLQNSQVQEENKE